MTAALVELILIKTMCALNVSRRSNYSFLSRKNSFPVSSQLWYFGRKYRDQCFSDTTECAKPESIIFDALKRFLELENYLDSVAVEWRRIQIGLKLVLTIDRLWQTRFSKAFPLSYHQSITIIPKKWSGQTKSFFDFLLRKKWINLHNS